MQDSQKNVRVALEQTKERLAVLEEIDLLDSEFKLIQHEYIQRKRTLEERLEALTKDLSN